MARLYWNADIRQDMYEVLEAIINQTASEDPLLFLTLPKLSLIKYNATTQECLIEVEDVSILFTTTYSAWRNRVETFTISSYTEDIIDGSCKRRFEPCIVMLTNKAIYCKSTLTRVSKASIKLSKILSVLEKLKLIR